MKSYRRHRSFGPSVFVSPDGTFTPSCDWCTFRIGLNCTYAKPSREIPNPDNTPEWCEMRESMIQDAKDAQEAEARRAKRAIKGAGR